MAWRLGDSGAASLSESQLVQPPRKLKRFRKFKKRNKFKGSQTSKGLKGLKGLQSPQAPKAQTNLPSGHSGRDREPGIGHSHHVSSLTKGPRGPPIFNMIASTTPTPLHSRTLSFQINVLVDWLVHIVHTHTPTHTHPHIHTVHPANSHPSSEPRLFPQWLSQPRTPPSTKPTKARAVLVHPYIIKPYPLYHLTYTTASLPQEPCSKTSTHNCWPPKASRHIPKSRGVKKMKKVSAMMEQWIAQTADEGPWTALGCQGNTGFSPETATDEKKEG